MNMMAMRLEKLRQVAAGQARFTWSCRPHQQ